MRGGAEEDRDGGDRNSRGNERSRVRGLGEAERTGMGGAVEGRTEVGGRGVGWTGLDQRGPVEREEGVGVNRGMGTLG